MNRPLLFALALGPALAAAFPAQAQAPDRLGAFERAYGMGYGDAERPIEGSTRDANGNRLIVNGRMAFEEGALYGGLMDLPGGLETESAGPLSAIGNQLNVITQGSWNTVIIESTQINTGDVTAVLEGGAQ